MNNNCLDQLVEGQAQIYRLLDSWINGTQYAQLDGVVSPPIPAAPPASSTAANAARAQLRRMSQLAENAATGAEYAAGSAMEGTVGLDFNGSWVARFLALQGSTGGFFGIGDTPVTLAQLLQAGRVNTNADQGLINDGIQEVLSTVANGGSIAGPLATLLGTGADVASDGGVIAATLAAAVAQQATAGLLAGQLDGLSTQIDALVQAIDGAGLRSPQTNVLKLLQGGLYGITGGEGEEAVTMGLVSYLVTRLGGAGVVSPLFLLNKIANEIGPLVNGLTANEQLDAIRQAAGGGGAPVDLGPLLAKLEELKGELTCICDALGGGSEGGTDPTPPAFTPAACGEGYTAPDVTSDPLDFSTSTTVAWATWANSSANFTRQTINVGGQPRAVLALAVPLASVCVQLSKWSDDPGSYSVQIDPITLENDPAPGLVGAVSMNVPPNTGQTTTMSAESTDNQTQVYKMTVFRTNDGTGVPNTYSGPGPVVYISVGALG